MWLWSCGYRFLLSKGLVVSILGIWDREGVIEVFECGINEG